MASSKSAIAPDRSPHLLPRVPAVGVGHRETRIDLDGFVVILDGAGGVSPQLLQDASVEVDDRIPRVDLDGLVEVGERPLFAPESRDVVGVVRRQQLDRHVAAERLVAGLPDHAHAAAPQRVDERVLSDAFSHGRSARWRTRREASAPAMPAPAGD
jgi:hypothetical protein